MANTSSGEPGRRPLAARLFQPILAGATLKERLIGCVGAVICICLTGFICSISLGPGAPWPLIVAPMGASAVLLFAIPASPLAQPWPIIGGNVISALTGVAVHKLIPEPALAIGLAVGGGILMMSLTRSLHPPGGAAALTAVIGGPAVAASGFLFPFVPVAINSVMLVALAVVFHRIAGHNYPHKAMAPTPNPHRTADPTPALRVGFNARDIDAALEAFHETLDIGRDDLDQLLREVERQALARQHGEITCKDIMSRDVISIGHGGTPAQARALLLDHDIRTLPVIAADGTLIGTVGLRELAPASDDDALPIASAQRAAPDDAVVSLVPLLTDGKSHAVLVTGPDNKVQGIISQTDLLAALSRTVSMADAAAGR